MQNVTPVDSPTPDAITAAMRKSLRQAVSWSDGVKGYAATAGGTVTVVHNLGQKPTRITIEAHVDGEAWWDEDDRKLWNEKTVTFHVSSVGSYTVHVGRI